MDKKAILESAGSLITKNVPTVSGSESVKEILGKLAKHEWDSISMIYVLSEERELIGEIPIKKLVSAPDSAKGSTLMIKPRVIIHEHEDQERIAIEAIAYDLKSMPVKDKEGRFLGAVTAEKIIDVLHEEHLEDFLRSSGISGRGAKILDLLTASFWDLIKSRLPWLVVGLAIGLGASVVVSTFADHISRNIALVFFMPIVAFMSGAIGTQTETVLVRSLTYLKVSIWKYLIKELILGMMIGLVIGSITGVFAYLISGSFQIASVIVLSLFASMSVATTLGVLVPLTLRYLKKDPAVGSGPFITSLQDLISLSIYFTIASVLLN